MFEVKWVKHRYERLPVEAETSYHDDLDAVVASCLKKLPEIRQKHPMNPPDGFLVFDEAGHEVRRWFGAERSHA
jgi:hypothetical protein